MATKIVTKNSSTAGAAPTATDLVQGELAVNVADGRLYTEDNAAAIVELGVNPATEITANAGISLPDSQKATFGAGDDLQIYHDGTASYIVDAGTGDLILQAGNDLILRQPDGSTEYLRANEGAGVQIYHNGSQKFLTTSTGIDVTGTATMDGLTVDSTTGFSWLPVSTAGAKVGVIGTGTGLIINTPSVNSSYGSGLAIDGSYASDLSSVNVKAFGPKFSSYGSELNLFTSDDTSLLKRQTIASNGDISFYEDTGTTAKFFWDSSAESLGIGTSNPAAKLHLNSASTTAIMFDSDTSTQQYELGIGYGGVGTSSFYLFDNTANATRLVVNSSGNVGIGTSSPAYPLVVSNSGAQGLEFIVGPTNFIQSYNRSAADYTPLKIDAETIAFATDNGTERMRITSAGSVGINTSSPATVTGGIHVVHNAGEGTPTVIGSEVGIFQRNAVAAQSVAVSLISGTASTASIYFGDKDDIDAGEIAWSNSSNSFSFNGGNVGIGTSSPSGALQVYKSGLSAYQAYTNTGTGLILQSYQSQGNPYTKTSDIVAGSDGTVPSEIRLLTRTAGSSTIDERMRIDSSGNVLVGTSEVDVGYTDSGAGASMNPAGFIQVARSSVNALGYFNKLDNDGQIIRFSKDGAEVGSIGTVSSRLTIGSNDVGLFFDSTNERFTPINQAAQTDRDAAIDLGYASSRFKDLYLSGGVYLGGTGAANKLDDYEEGTWTPRIDGTTTAGTHTYLQQDGFYVKVGKLVTITGTIYGSGGTGAGNLLLKGLPFTYISHHGGHGTFQVNGSMPFPTGTITAVFVTDNAGGFYVRCTKDNANMEYLAYPVTVNYLRFTFSYFTDQ